MPLCATVEMQQPLYTHTHTQKLICAQMHPEDAKRHSIQTFNVLLCLLLQDIHKCCARWQFFFINFAFSAVARHVIEQITGQQAPSFTQLLACVCCILKVRSFWQVSCWCTRCIVVVALVSATVQHSMTLQYSRRSRY